MEGSPRHGDAASAQTGLRLTDRNGNITSADDAATGGNGAGWDAKYAMDNLDRLIDADEGTLSAGSIGSRTRRERWDQNTSGLGLDQVGNWLRRKLDLDGDGNYTSGGELDDTGAFNAANEWLTRDIDSNSSVNYTLAHDAVGNMTDDGKDYTYVYDVFGRLVKVKARGSGNTVAEYAYDGLGQRIFYHADEDADGTVEASNDDPKYNFVYDDRWRIVATYRVPYSGGVDATPKETFVWHVAGVDGQGGSSYIDTVILRDRDANGGGGWTGAADGTLEERRFYLQNWRADVSAVCNTSGRPLERIKYSAYGTPITLADIDYNNDGVIDPDDPGDFVNSPYDWNLDGTTDSADDDDFFDDYSAVSGNAYGRGTLSLAGIGNRLGYAGYVYDRFISGSDGGKWHVRHRVLDSGLGRWTRRDPLGYVDRANFHEYVGSDPLMHIDFDGQISMRVGAGGHCIPGATSACETLVAGDGNLGPPSIYPFPPASVPDWRSLPFGAKRVSCDGWARSMAMRRMGMDPRTPCWNETISAMRACCSSPGAMNLNGGVACVEPGLRARAECMRRRAIIPGACYDACLAEAVEGCEKFYLACLAVCSVGRFIPGLGWVWFTNCAADCTIAYVGCQVSARVQCGFHCYGW